MVTSETLASISDKERKRQEIIFEIITTEREYVQDLRMLKRVYMDSLERADIVRREQRAEFICAIFGNLNEVLMVNSVLDKAMWELQQQRAVVQELAPCFLPWSTRLQPYIAYGANQVLAKHVLDAELRTNLALRLFCEVGSQ
jgi:hypothetical protein